MESTLKFKVFMLNDEGEMTEHYLLEDGTLIEKKDEDKEEI